MTGGLRRALCGAVLACVLIPGRASQPLGEAPVLDAGARDLAAIFQLPALRDGVQAPAMQQLRELQVGRRAVALALTSVVQVVPGAEPRDPCNCPKRAASPPPAGRRRFRGPGVQSMRCFAMLRASGRSRPATELATNRSVHPAVTLARPCRTTGRGAADPAFFRSRGARATVSCATSRRRWALLSTARAR